MNKYMNNDCFKFLCVPACIFIIYYFNPANLFVIGNELSFIAVILTCFTIEYFISKAKNGQSIYMRPIPAMKAMEEAVGRATEMGKPVLYVPGISGLDQIDTLAGLTFLGHVSNVTERYTKEQKKFLLVNLDLLGGPV